MVIDGFDSNHRPPPHDTCSNYRLFLIKLPGVDRTFKVRAAAPNYARWFPACVPVVHSRLVPRSALSVKPFTNG
jgi:hypothetical protein